jgi:ABC-type transport system involved in Fe-S cluster assembly fused permease/ATPase subunit
LPLVSTLASKLHHLISTSVNRFQSSTPSTMVDDGGMMLQTASQSSHHTAGTTTMPSTLHSASFPQLTTSHISRLIESLHWSVPAVVLGYVIIALINTNIRLNLAKLKRQERDVRGSILTAVMGLVACTYLASIANIGVEFLRDPSSVPSHDSGYNLALLWIYLWQPFHVISQETTIWQPFVGGWLLTLAGELILLAIRGIWVAPVTRYDYVSGAICICRISLLVLLPSMYWHGRRSGRVTGTDEENQPLLAKDPDTPADAVDATSDTAQHRVPPNGTTQNGAAHGTVQYGATTNGTAANGTATNGSASTKPTTADDDTGNLSDTSELDEYYTRDKIKEKMAKRLAENGSWWTYLKGFRVLLSHMMPGTGWRLTLRFVAMLSCVVLMQLVSLSMPIFYGRIINKLSDGEGPWGTVAIWISLQFLAAGSGIGLVKDFLWVPLEAGLSFNLRTAAHRHAMDLSSDYHDSMDSWEIMNTINRGLGVTSLVEIFAFQILPTIFTLFAVTIVLGFSFGPYMAFTVALVGMLYWYMTSYLIAKLKEFRKVYIAAQTKVFKSLGRSLNNWRTACYFNNIQHEKDTFQKCIKRAQLRTEQYQTKGLVNSGVQNGILSIGQLAVACIAIYRVKHNLSLSGDFVTAMAQWALLTTPLTIFSSVFKRINESLLDAEGLLELFKEQPTIQNKAAAPPLVLDKGAVEFKNVCYHYDERKETIKDVSFFVPGGDTIAIVGETGAGKSTILKLLNRFYDVGDGSITIDGQDIRDVTIESLREHVGVVPQDPSIFYDSIYNNIRYARLDATREEVYEACKAAAIHDKIMSFPDGYKSRVGAQGVKLSGGERQRLAIARTILKRPSIIILDEATSAVDSDTEDKIQAALKVLCAGRTTFIVAHRLSTIMHAQRILVIRDGEVIQDGTHEELIHAKGKYLDMWSKQINVKSEKPLPQSKTSSSRSSSRDSVANIVNDVQPQMGNTSLATAIRRASHDERTCSVSPSRSRGRGGEGGDVGGGHGDDVQAERPSESGTQTPSGVARPCCAPDAHGQRPFIPPASKSQSSSLIPVLSSRSRSTEAAGSEAVSALTPDVEQLHPFSAFPASPNRSAKQSAGLSGRAAIRRLDSSVASGYRSDFSDRGQSKSREPSPHAAHARSHHTVETSRNASQSPERPRMRRPYSRRHQTASEPVSESQRESLDGVGEAEGAEVVNPGEGTPLLGARPVAATHRRVTAPSDPPSGSASASASASASQSQSQPYGQSLGHGQGTSESGRGISRGRGRRSRHWRLKAKREGQTGGVADGSSAGEGGVPVVPTPTPAGGSGD